MLSARLILVRHGQSTYNAQARLQGQADPPLSEAGRAEARAAAPALPASPPSGWSRSDLRARERDRGAARLSRRRGATRASARSTSARGRDGRCRTSRTRPATAWRGGPLHADDGESLGRPAGARRRRPRRAARRGSAPGSSSATAAWSAPRSRTSPAPTRAASPGPANASVTIVRAGRAAAARGLRLDARRLSAIVSSDNRKFLERAAFEPVTPLASWGLCRAAHKWEPAGRHNGAAVPAGYPHTAGARRLALDTFEPRRLHPRADAPWRRPRRRRGGVAQELLDRGDHRGGLLGRRRGAVQLEARTAVHRRSHATTADPPPADGWQGGGRWAGWNTWREPEEEHACGGSLRLGSRVSPESGDPTCAWAVSRVTRSRHVRPPPRPRGAGLACSQRPSPSPIPPASPRPTRRSGRMAPAPFTALRTRTGRGPRDPAPARPARGRGPRADAPLARLLRPAHRPADRRRDVAGAGGLRRPRGRREQLVVAPAGGVRAAGLRPDGPQHQRQPHERRSPTPAASGPSSASRSRPATWPTTSSSTRRAGSRPCSTAGRSTRSPASRSAPPTRARARRRTTVAALNAAVAARLYTGVADYDDYRRRRRPTATAASGTRTSAPPAGGPYAAFPRYPGLMERAQNAFTAEGLKVPWYIARGNHDGLSRATRPPAPTSSARSPRAA